MRPLRTLAASLAVVATAAGVAHADGEARRWLSGMTEALASRTYEGEFVHLARGHVERMRILHRVHDGHVNERLINLSDHGREVIRNGLEVQCYLPDQHQVLVETHESHGTLLGTLPSFDENIDASYRVDLAGRSRSALGRSAQIVAVAPRDGYRYGYRVWIDEETHMPVRTELNDASGAVLEQFVFTELRMLGTLPDAAFRPAIAAEGFTWIRQPGLNRGRGVGGLPWHLEQLPPGFRVSSSGEELLPGGGAMVTHLVVSDGLASVSVFIEGPPAPPRQASEGQGHLGSSEVYSKVVDGHQVTVVGEVPPATVQFIARAVAADKSPVLAARP